MTKRTDRKSFIKKNGIENYGFNDDKEFNKYCFLCGSRLSKKQWKMLADSDKFYTYAAWKQDIRKKYELYPVEGLKEFSRYLNQCQRNLIPIGEGINISISAMIAMFFTFALDEIKEMVKPEKLALGVVFVILEFIVLFVILVPAMRYIFYNVIDVFSEEKLRIHFFSDLKEIIDELVREKSGE